MKPTNLIPWARWLTVQYGEALINGWIAVLHRALHLKFLPRWSPLSISSMTKCFSCLVTSQAEL